MSVWHHNRDGHWCPSCGHLVAHRDSGGQPDQCRECGYPDDIEAMARYHVGDDA